MDDTLFQRIMHNPNQHLLPARRELVYNIRQRPHDMWQLKVLSPASCVNVMSLIVCCSRTVTDSVAYLRVCTYIILMHILTSYCIFFVPTSIPCCLTVLLFRCYWSTVVIVLFFYVLL